LLGLGANVGDPREQLRAALTMLTSRAPTRVSTRQAESLGHGTEPRQEVGLGGNPETEATGNVEFLAVSSLYRTEPVGYAEQDWFLNAAARLRTTLTPRALLERLMEIERALGRVRGIANGPRTIDLDILLWGGLVLDDDALTLPHPRLHERRFVLEPLVEIAPGLRHPLLGRTMRELLAGCASNRLVERIGGPEWFPLVPLPAHGVSEPRA
jgi:2-amino-4-hydroxy-6-hydroxymethyldihydropteridine diphosphokinase